MLLSIMLSSLSASFDNFTPSSYRLMDLSKVLEELSFEVCDNF